MCFRTELIRLRVGHMFRTRLPIIPLSAQGFAKYLTASNQFFFAPCEFQIPSGEWMLMDFTLSDMIRGTEGLKRTQKLEGGSYEVKLCAISFTRDDQGRKVLGSLILPVIQFVLDEYDSMSTGVIVFLQEEALPCALNVLRSIAYSFPTAAVGIEQACGELISMGDSTGQVSGLTVSYRLGLDRLRELLTNVDTETTMEFAGFDARLLENLSAEELHGSTETIRHERSQIVTQLNRLASEVFGRTFNDLCRI